MIEVVHQISFRRTAPIAPKDVTGVNTSTVYSWEHNTRKLSVSCKLIQTRLLYVETGNNYEKLNIHENNLKFYTVDIYLNCLNCFILQCNLTL